MHVFWRELVPRARPMEIKPMLQWTPSPSQNPMCDILSTKRTYLNSMEYMSQEYRPVCLLTYLLTCLLACLLTLIETPLRQTGVAILPPLSRLLRPSRRACIPLALAGLHPGLVHHGQESRHWLRRGRLGLLHAAGRGADHRPHRVLVPVSRSLMGDRVPVILRSYIHTSPTITAV